jgi:hypothetical protein
MEASACNETSFQHSPLTSINEECVGEFGEFEEMDEAEAHPPPLPAKYYKESRTEAETAT